MRLPLFLLSLLASCQGLGLNASELQLEVLSHGEGKFMCSLSNPTEKDWMVLGHGGGRPSRRIQVWNGQSWDSPIMPLAWSMFVDPMHPQEEWAFSIDLPYEPTGKIRVIVEASPCDPIDGYNRIVTITASPSNTVTQADVGFADTADYPNRHPD